VRGPRGLALLAAATIAALGAGAVSGPGAVGTTYVPVSAADPVLVAGTDCRAFPVDNFWNTPVDDLPRHPRSDAWLANMSTDRNLHPDFGPSFGGGPDYGIPVTVVGEAHDKVRVRFDYADESDHVRYPFGSDTRIEGGRGSDGDKHAVVVDRSTCRLFETWNTRTRDNRWYAGSGATWSLTSNRLRPDGWTSADAAGLPILPGLLRHAEVEARRVDHAIRFTTDVTSRWHLWPARHDAGSTDDRDFPPMGARFRLRRSFDPSAFGPGARAVIRAMKVYGLVLADNGSPWYFQGEQHARWSQRLVSDLKRIPASAFVAVDTRSMRVSKDSARAR
jgi:hypothetical protein